MKNELEINNFNKIQHLKMIQKIIERMARNSFYMKGIIITITGPLIYLIIRISEIFLKNEIADYFGGVYLLFGFLIMSFLLVIGILDAFFLGQERLYRDLYNEVREKKEKINFSMNSQKFKCKNKRFQVCLCEVKCKSTILYTFFSKTLTPFYLVFLLIYIAMWLTPLVGLVTF